MSEKAIYFTLAVFGFALAFAISFISEKGEPWDSGLFWTVGLPAMMLAAGVAGYHRPDRTWSFGFAVVGGFVAWIVGVNNPFIRGFGSLWPVGLLFGAVLGLVCGVGALLGSKLRQRRNF